MRQVVRVSCILAIAFAATAGASGAQKAAVVKTATGPLQTGTYYYSLGSSAANQTEAARIRAAGAGVARIALYWSSVAPTGSAPPTGFQPRDPADPNYRWQGIDAEVQTAAAAGLQPMVQILGAPEWARGSSPKYRAGTYKPSPSALANFAAAAAKRYSGSYESLPRVRYWQIWNEPNLDTYLSPQMEKGKPFASKWYRSMLNASADAIHSVHADNIVIAGETSPFGTVNASKGATSPLYFMERVLCIAEKKTKKKTKNAKTRVVTISYKSACKTKTKFDVWSHHPYTQSGPTGRSMRPGNVSLGDMGNMRAVLNTAIRAGHIKSKTKVRLWATEFSWDSKPPDPKGVPAALEARWVSEALYRLWSNGVSLVVWLELRDQPFPDSFYQSGLYYANPAGIASDSPKPALRSFRFPFVALPQLVKGKKTAVVWGRTPTSKKVTVLIERKTAGKWKRAKVVKANRYGIFKLRITALPKKTTYMRARLANGKDVSTPFALNAPKKGWKGCIFGTCTG